MPAPHEDVPLRVLREALKRYYNQPGVTLRQIQKELGVKSPQTVKDLISGKTENPSKATRRKWRKWYMRTYRKIYGTNSSDDTGRPEEPKLIAIQLLAEDFSSAEQKEMAADIVEMLEERYARAGGRAPAYLRRLKKLIDVEWP